MLISQIVKDKPIQGVLTAAPNALVGEVAKILSEKRIGGMVVAEAGGPPMGIITERDIVRELGRRGTVCLEDKVSDMMTKKLITCSPSDRAIAVLQVMTEKRFRHMPVIDEDGKMVGIVSIGDVVKGRLEELSNQAESLKAMIMGF